MSPVPPASGFTIAGGEITLDAELPAPKLRLSANADYPGLLDLVRTVS